MCHGHRRRRLRGRGYSFAVRLLGRTTERLGGVVARAPSSCEIVAHPLLIKLCEGILGRQILNMAAEELLETCASSPNACAMLLLPSR